MPKYSLIIPAFNEERTIRRSLESLKNQLFKDFEIILVDNNSNDRTAEIAKEYADVIVREKKQGYMNAANTGAAKSKCDYIAFCDADCIYPPDWLKKHNILLMKENLIASYGSAKFYDHNWIFNQLSLPVHHIMFGIPAIFGRHLTPTFNLVMKRKSFFEAGAFNEQKFNGAGFDLELGTRLDKVGKVKFSLSPVTYISARRYKKNGLFDTIWMYVNAGINIMFNGKQTVDYKEYNRIKTRRV